MIKNVIFDLGNVLINNDPSEYIKTLGFSEEKTEALNQALSTDTTWHDKDMGIYESYKDCIPIFQRNHPELEEEILWVDCRKEAGASIDTHVHHWWQCTTVSVLD